MKPVFPIPPVASTRRHGTLPGWLAALAAMAALLSAPASAGVPQPPGKPVLDFDLVFGEHSSGRSPRDATWSRDGDRLAYLWDDGGGDGIWLFDAEAKTKRKLLALGGAEDDSLEGVSSLQWSPGGQSLLVVSGGDLHLVDAGSGGVRRLTETAAEEQDPKFSPDGGRLAFVRDYDLYLLELSTGEARALTGDGAQNEILNATTDWVYWEEIWGRDATGYWWSPRGDRIAYYRFDERGVKSYPLVDFTTQYPTVEWQKYPKAGEANPVVQVGVLDLGSGETRWIETGGAATEEFYLARVDWRPAGDLLALQRLNREQDRLDLLLCDPLGGTCSTLLTEASDTWINLTNDLRFLPDDRFLWTSEKSGWNRLYLHAPDGEVEHDLTPPGWTVAQVDQVTRDAVFFTAYETTTLGALHRVVMRQPLPAPGEKPAPPARVGSGSGWNQANTAAGSGRTLLTTSTADRLPERVILEATGEEIAQLASTPPAYDPAALPAWRFLTIEGAGEVRLPAALLQPADFDPESIYPALMYHYGGPASQVVADRWAGTRNLWHKMMAERGYVVLLVDNPGSNFFGKRGADLLHRRFGEVNLAAQRAGVAYLGTLGFVDTARVGLWGWSGGGANTLYSLLNSPGTWKAGVSGAPVTDWRFYDTIWTERYLDHPEDNAEGYRDSSAITYADRLADKLLIVHGTGDDNVHPQNTFAMARKLIDAGRLFEDAIYPRQKHGFRGIDSRHFYERMTEFFERHLAAAAASLPAVAPAAAAR